MDLVLDASVAVPALVGRSVADHDLRTRLSRLVCCAPHLIDAEVGNVLRRRVSSGAVEAETARASLVGLESVVDVRFAHGPLTDVAWSLRANLSFYDALYVALAARLDISLLTADARLARAPGLPCHVELVSSGPAPGTATPS